MCGLVGVVLLMLSSWWVLGNWLSVLLGMGWVVYDCFGLGGFVGWFALRGWVL